MDSLGLTEAWPTGQRWPEERLSFNLRLALNSEQGGIRTTMQIVPAQTLFSGLQEPGYPLPPS